MIRQFLSRLGAALQSFARPGDRDDEIFFATIRETRVDSEGRITAHGIDEPQHSTKGHS